MTKYRTLEASTDSLARFGRAIASPIRIRALQALRRGELCLCELTALFRMADSTLSKHMSILGDVGLVQSRREGKWTHYSLPTQPTPEVSAILELVERMAAADPLVAEDAGRISGLCCGPVRNP